MNFNKRDNFPGFVKRFLSTSKLSNGLLIIFLIFGFIFQTGCEDRPENNKLLTVEGLFNKADKLERESDEYAELADSAFNLSQKIDFPEGIIKATWYKGRYFYANREYEKAFEKFKIASEDAEKLGNLKLLGDIYESLGFVYNRFKDVEKSTTYFRRSAEFRGEIGDSVGTGISYNNAGFIFWQASEYDSAIIYFEKALEIRERMPQKEYLASTCNNIGTVYYNWSIYDKALEFYLRALEIQKELGIDNSVALTLTNIGLVYDETGQTEKAFSYYKESLPYALSSENSETLGYVYNSIARSYAATDIDSAVYYYNRSLESYKEANYIGGEILVYRGLGRLEETKNNLAAAKDYYYRILLLSEQNGIRVRTTEAAMLMGQVYLKENNFDLAKKFFLRSIKVGEEINVKNFPRDSYLYLSEIYDRKGKLDSAYITFKNYEELNREINNADMQRRLTELKSSFEMERYKRTVQTQKYQNEKQKIYLWFTLALILFLAMASVILYGSNRKRQKINNLLTEKNELIEGQKNELNNSNKQLVELNNSKDKLFSIIAHDLKSPFNTLIHFTDFLKEDYYELSDDERLGYITEIDGTAKKTYELLENLLFLSASRTGRLDFNPSVNELKKMVKDNIELYVAQIKKKSLSVNLNVSEELTVYADTNMLKLVLRNLLNNAIKYCNHGGAISISGEEIDDKVFISVEDKGIGMDDQTLENIFNINVIRSQQGTEGEKGTGLGLGLCKEFIEKHNGEIFVESKLNKGSKFSFYLPDGAK